MNNKYFLFALVAIVTIGVVVLFAEEDTQEEVTSSEVQSGLRLSDIHGLEVDIVDPEKIYLANHQGLYMQESDGIIKKVGTISDDFMGFSVDPIDPATFYASGHPKTGGNFGITKTINNGQSWNDVSEGLGGPVDFHTMAVDNSDANIIYGYYQGALQRTIDGGQTWQYAKNAPSQIIQLSAGSEKNSVYAATTNGLHISNDSGETWSILRLADNTVVAVEVNQKNNSILASTVDQGLLQSKDNGKTWQEVDFEKSETVLYIATSPSEESRSYLATKTLKIYQSDDGGETWSLR